MSEVLRSPIGQTVIWLTVLAMFIAVAYYVLARMRQEVRSQEPGSSDLMSRFRELHDQGAIDSEEYKSIKSRLQNRLQEELSDSEEAD